MALGQNIGWLEELRAQGQAAFRAQGLPTTRLESWKYTSLKSLDGFAFARPGGPGGAPATDRALAALGGARLVFVNGLFEAGASNLKGAALPLSQALARSAATVHANLGHVASADDPLSALNSATIDDGLVLFLDGSSEEEPIVVEHRATTAQDGVALHPRSLIVLKRNARATVIERYSGAGRYLTNPLGEIVVEEGARLTHVRLFEDDEAAFNLAQVSVRIGKDAGYDSYVLATGGALVRSEIKVDLAAPGAEASLNGAYLARGKQHSDHTTLLLHSAPHTTSREVYKGALDDAARGVFQGNIRVAKGADGTDGNMSNKTLLLSDKCEMDTKPQLEIYADDVKCAHGATVGELEEDALFYLRARGIPEAQARQLLVRGFVAGAFEALDGTAIGDLLQTRIAAWLGSAELKEAA